MLRSEASARTICEQGLGVLKEGQKSRPVASCAFDRVSCVVVIVSYRSADLTIQCLESLVPELEDLPGLRIAICENGSGDDSADRIAAEIERRDLGGRVELTVIEHNRGFSGGNNVILRRVLESDSCPDFFLLLNADMIVHPGAIRTLLETAVGDSEIGVVGPRLEWPDGSPQVSAFRFQTPISEFLASARTGPFYRLFKSCEVPIHEVEKPIQPQWVSFACALIRREVFEQIGCLDDGYFLYFEDPDFCRRARNDHWRVLYHPDARVVHLRGGSGPVKSLTAQRKRRPRYFYASRARFLAKSYGVLGLWLGNVLWTLGRCVSLLRETFGKKEPHVCEKEWLDIWTNCFHPRRMPESVKS